VREQRVLRGRYVAFERECMEAYTVSCDEDDIWALPPI
jgi:hypothetical protein